MFYFRSCFLFLLFLLHLLFNKKKLLILKHQNKILGPSFSVAYMFCCGGTLRFFALRAMLVSVVGVGVHWLNVTMRSLYVQCMVKFFEIWLF